MVQIECACGCGRSKEVREADVRRGWGKYYSKSCKALHAAQQRDDYRKEFERKRQERLAQVQQELLSAFDE